MNLFQTFLASPIAGGIGWTLVHSLWEGALISAAFGAALVGFLSPRARYAAACGAMLAMVVCFTVTLTWTMLAHAPALRPSRTAAVPAWGALATTTTPVQWQVRLAMVAPWLALFWIVGVLLMYAERIVGCVLVRRLRRRGVCCASGYWQDEVTRLSARLRISRPIKLLESCLSDVPMVLGHFRPLILMPVGLLAGVPPAQVEAVLLHELAHIRRCDYLMNLLQRFAGGLFFYHPAAWWFSRVMRVERENCCDDVVVSISGDAYEYAAALATLEQNRVNGRVPAMVATGGNLSKRIRRLLYPRPNGALAPFLVAGILLALVLWASLAKPVLRRDAPSFGLRDSKGVPISLSRYKGKIVLLNFWATWCAPCTTEIPWYIEFEKKYKASGLAVIGVALNNDRKAVRRFIAEQKVNYPVTIASNNVIKLYGVNQLPLTLLIDRNGRLVDKHIGVVNRENLKNEIETLLHQHGGAPSHSGQKGDK